MATITGNIATATNTGQLTYDASSRRGGAGFKVTHVSTIYCMRGRAERLESGVWRRGFVQGKGLMAKHKTKKQWIKRKAKNK